MVDPTTDMLNRIRNAQAVGKLTVDLPFSNFKYQIAKLLEKQGFIEKTVKIKTKKSQKEKIGTGLGLELTLKYSEKMPAISGLKRISKSGQKIYVPWKKIKRVKTGFGMSIISTSRGLMTNKEARRQKLGGEIICEIW